VLGGCKHRFCYECGGNWLKALIEGGGTYDSLRCVFCPGGLTYAEVKQLVSCSRLRSTLERTSLELCLTKMEDFTWCRWCQSGGIAQSTGCTDVQCNDCSRAWCMLCGFNAHAGMSCEEYHATDEHKSEKWTMEVARHCPSCKVPIEKNGGCNDMTCSRCLTWMRGRRMDGRMH